MATYYIFNRIAEIAALVVKDKTGANLAKYPAGPWVYFKEVELNRLGLGTMGVLADEIIDAIDKNGYFRWPQAEPTSENGQV
jgi:hypothetical protein